MKKIIALSTALALTLGLCACTAAQLAESTDSTTWQEQYDLGVRYLFEGNYEEAIIAFTAAIEIDPKQVDAYIGLADVYVALGDTERATRVLNNALATVEAPHIIQAKLDELAKEHEYDSGLSEEIDTSQDSVDISQLLKSAGTVSFDDFAELQAILSVPADQFDSYWPVDKTEPVYSFDDGLLLCYKYGINGVDIEVYPLVGSTETQRIQFSSIFSSDFQVLPIRFRGIEIGDSYVTVIEKLGLSLQLQDYNNINIDLSNKNIFLVGNTIANCIGEAERNPDYGTTIYINFQYFDLQGEWHNPGLHMFFYDGILKEVDIY